MNTQKIREVPYQLVGFMTTVKFEGMTAEIQDAVERSLAVIEAELPRWIPCSERMPERTGNYLCLGILNRFCVNPSMWVDLWSSEDRMFGSSGITHWQPLPEPPQEEEEEEGE